MRRKVEILSSATKAELWDFMRGGLFASNWTVPVERMVARAVRHAQLFGAAEFPARGYTYTIQRVPTSYAGVWLFDLYSERER